jgi:hypothetical protein
MEGWARANKSGVPLLLMIIIVVSPKGFVGVQA